MSPAGAKNSSLVPLVPRGSFTFISGLAWSGEAWQSGAYLTQRERQSAFTRRGFE